MGFKLETKPLNIIYRSLGLEEQGKVQQFLGKTVADNLRKYVSLKTNVQQESTNPINGGKQVIINVPYARFQAEGKVMVGVKTKRPWAKKGEKKIVTSRNLKYHSGRLRGSHPFERMKADKGQSILNRTARYARGISNR